jgi:hypothetical protein
MATSQIHLLIQVGLGQGKDKAMRQDFQNVTIIPARACGSSLDAGIKDQEKLYLAWDQRSHRLFVVQWDRVRWVCSCGGGICEHKMRVNDFLVEEFQKQLVEDEWRSNS